MRCNFIGYSEGSKGYRFYSLTTGLIESRDEEFFEELNNKSIDSLIDPLDNKPNDIVEHDLIFDEWSENELTKE